MESRACSVLFLFLAASIALAVPPDGPRLDPDPMAVELGGTAEPLPVGAAVHAALIFSGAPARDLPALEAAFLDRTQKAREAVSGIQDPAARGEALLTFMHEGFLSRYVETQTRLDVLLQNGSYNCVSSAVLYMILGNVVGLEAGGVMTTDHAFCTVRLAGVTVDVETTNRFGWNPGTRKDFLDSFGKTTGYIYVPPREYAVRKEIGQKAMLGLILANRIVDLERAGRFADAVPLAADRYAASADAMSFDYLMDRLFNYGGDLANRHRSEEALDFLERVRARFGENPRLAALQRTAVGNRLSELAAAGRYDEGVAFAEAMRERTGDDPMYADFLRTATNNQIVALIRTAAWAKARALLDARLSSGRIDAAEGKRLSSMIAAAELDRAVTGLPFRDALQAAVTAHREGTIDEARFAEILVFLYAGEGQKVAKEAGWLEAGRLVGEALALLPGEPRLQYLLSAFRKNHAAGEHNRFAALYNAGRYAEAKGVVEEALRYVPESDLLKRDLDMAARAMARH